MIDLCEQLCLPGHVCFMGIGNVHHGDDGFGVRLAEQLDQAGVPDVLVAGTTPEHCIGTVTDHGYDHLVFLDAVEFGGSAGSAVFLDSTEITGKFPQISTHKMSLGTLAKLAEAGGKTQVWLLGVQPEALKGGDKLSPAVQKTMELLAGLLSKRRPVKPEPAKAHCRKRAAA